MRACEPLTSKGAYDADACGRAIESHVASRAARKTLAWILSIGALVRIALVWRFGSDAPTITDALDYNQLAVGIVENGSYVSQSGQLISLRPPLYPAVAAAIYKLFGLESYLAVSIFHGALSLVTVWLAFRLGTEVYSERVGLGAAALTCFYPSLLAYNQFFLSEVLFTFFVTAGALLSVKVLKTAGIGAAVLLGVALGLGALTRSVLWLFAPLLSLGLAMATHAGPGRRMAVATVTFVAFAATIAPWAIRNTRLQKTFTVIDVMGGRNVMMGNYEYTPRDRSWATIETETGDRAWHRVLAAKTPGYSKLTQGQIDKAAMRYGVEYFFSHPWQSLTRSTVKFFNFWQLEREIVAGMRQGTLGSTPLGITIAVAIFVCAYYAITLFAALFGALMTPPADRSCHLLLVAWIAFPAALHAIAFAHSRYHLPLVPILTVYAAAAFVQRGTIIERRRTWAFATAGVACALLVASWMREFVILDMKWFV
jgi:hypothetical protein